MSHYARLIAARVAQVADPDRRSGRRHPYKAQAAAQPVRDEQGSWRKAQVANLSVAGIGLLLDRRPERGELLSVELPAKDGEGSRKLLARVATVKTHAAGTWFVGCTLLRKLDDVELLALL